MADKSNKLKARLPRGLADRGPAEIAATRRMIEAIRAVYERYGFEGVETPAIEYTDALGKFLPDQDRPNEGVFSFQDDDDQWLSLRYDLTAPLARYVAENFDTLPKPYRSYRYGYVYRNEKPGPGRFRQFMQFDADTVGSASMAADAEICMMAADTMEALGIPRGSYVVKVNNRKVLDGVMDAIGIGGEANSGKRLTVLRAIDKFDRLGVEGVRQLLGPGRKDESGDFTKGAGLDQDTANILIETIAFEEQLEPQVGYDSVEFPNPYYLPPSEWPESQRKRCGRLLEVNQSNQRRERHRAWDYLGIVALLYELNDSIIDALRELEAMADLVISSGYSDRVILDPSVVRGLEYYTGPVYEVELTFPITGDDGKPVRFGSVAGGGRYDGLVARFRGEPVPATGFSIGVSRLMAALQHLGKVETKPEPGPVVVTVFDRDRIADYQRMVSALRAAGIRAEMYLGSGKFGPQMKYADKRNSPCVVIQGGDEKAKGEIQIKDLILGSTLTAIKDRDEYLKKQAEAQFAVPEVKLVEAVRKVLARHNVKWA